MAYGSTQYMYSGLLFVNSHLYGKKFYLNKGETRIGRDQNQNDIIINESSILPQHARLLDYQGKIWLQNFDDQCYVAINGKQIKSAILADGDLITLGNTGIACSFFTGYATQPTIPPYTHTSSPPPKPLPLGQAVKHLFSQYAHVYTSPSRATFTVEIHKSSWNIIWTQLISLAILLLLPNIVIFDFIIPLLVSIFLRDAWREKTYAILGIFSVISTLSPLILVPLSFFLTVTIQYLAAKIFGGKGTLLQHAYAFALIIFPAYLITFIMALLPIAGALFDFALEIYVIILNILMIMAVHRIKGVKASIAVFFPLILAIICAIIIYVVALLL